MKVVHEFLGPVLVAALHVSFALIVIMSIPHILAGIGLLGNKKWAEPLVLVAGAIQFLVFPWGTALGAYTFYVILKSGETAR